MKITIGSRGSRLALAQSEWVRSRLQTAYPDIKCDIRIIHTKGDRILDKPLAEIGDKGLFVQEIEAGLLRGEIDLAVHSMKDMPSLPQPGLCFSQVWPRADRRDALILRQAHSLNELPQGACIATGSKRRAGQLARLRPDLQIVDIRGNVDTRLKKMESQKLDGLVLAAAGLERLGLLERVTSFFDPEEFLCAPAQGALALQLRENDHTLESLLNSLQDADADIEVRAERAFLAAVEGSCQIPVGACAHLCGDSLHLTALLGTEIVEPFVTGKFEGSTQNPEALGQQAAEVLTARLTAVLKGES